MGDKSAIEWTDATWNPVTGCSKVSPGCAHCYAETLSLRFKRSTAPWTPANAAQNVVLHRDRLDQPLRWTRPRMVFVNSMSDLFHDQVPDDYIDEVFDVMERAWTHTFQVLTKRPQRMHDFILARRDERGSWGDSDVEQNIWLGVSIENRRYVDRADLLRATPAAVRFISAEPLLGPLMFDTDIGMYNDKPRGPYREGDIYTRCWSDEYDGPELDLTAIDWLIVGGESGPGHRPMRAEWVRDLRDETETAFFFKQWGGARPKSNGRELDGRTWDEMPEGNEDHYRKVPD